MSRASVTLPFLLGLSVSLVACSGGDTPVDASTARDAGASEDAAAADATTGTDADTPDAGDPGDAGSVDAAPADAGDPDAGTATDSPDCDPLQPAVCAFPWPSNLYLAPAAERPTGHTLRFGATTLPANRARFHVDPAPYERLDGYGVGTPIMVLFPNLDVSALPGEDDIGASLAADAEILLYEVDPQSGLTRIPYFAEADTHEADPAVRLLFVRPAVILKENTRYVVAMRGLKDTTGADVETSGAFAALVAGNTAQDPRLQPRQARFDEVFQLLQGAGIDKTTLQLAWDFGTASCEALHGAMLHMRDDGLAAIDANLPVPTVTAVTEYIAAADGSGRPVDENMAFRVEGEVVVPSYLVDKTIGVFASTVLNRDVDGVPQQNGTRTMRFWMQIPHAARTATRTMNLVQYGHGLLGSGSQTISSYNRPVANQHGFILFGADLTGFHEEMITPVGVALREMSAFEWVSETTHQGMVEYLMLGRIMMRQASSLAVITSNNISVDGESLYYSGISQGGIFGATYMALSTDVVRGHLGVPGNNYSTLLHRSVDFDPFFSMLADAYPDPIDQAVLLSTVEQLWETSDPVSYLRHIFAEPFANTPSHQVLLAPAKGDYQVAVVTNEILARSNVGIPIMEQYDDERTVFGISEAPYPRTGSGIVLWDFGNPWPPAGNVTPMDALGDPHGLPRRHPAHVQQLGHFLKTGEIIDVCGGDGCHPD